MKSVLLSLFLLSIASPLAFAQRTVTVGDTICYTLTARDTSGAVITDWDQTGEPATITLVNSTANTDTSDRAWDSFPLGYSWAKMLHNGTELNTITGTEFLLPNDVFVDGVAEICLVNTKAEGYPWAPLYFIIRPEAPFKDQLVDSLAYEADEIENYLIDLTVGNLLPPDSVYAHRRYEIVVCPRDRFLNVSNEQIATIFSARYQDEFYKESPALSSIFDGTVYVSGCTNYFVASTTERVIPDDILQTITAHSVSDTTVRGVSNPYSVVPHAPFDFTLLSPPDHSIFNIGVNDSHVDSLTWERPNPPDPYWYIPVSVFTPERGSDVVSYTVVILDSASLTNQLRYESNGKGLRPAWTFSHQQFIDIGNTLTGSSGWEQANLVWYVEATDGTYTTRSTPPSPDTSSRRGWHITLNRTTVGVDKLPGTAEAFTLAQNYPNPFNPSTAIDFSVERAGDVSVKVYTPLGEEIATLVDEYLSAGNYTTSFSGDALPSGVYLYRLQAGGQVYTRQMVLMK